MRAVFIVMKLDIDEALTLHYCEYLSLIRTNNFIKPALNYVRFFIPNFRYLT